MATLAERWIQEGKQQGLQEGMQQGIQQGIQQGLQQGKQEGRIEEARATLLRILTHRFGSITSGVRSRIQEASLERLETWIDLSLNAKSLSEIFSNDSLS